MRSERPRRRTRKTEHLPESHTFARRLADLRALQQASPPAAGDQALKLLEEYLEALARRLGYEGDGSLRRYTMYLQGHEVLDAATLARIDGYADTRNCLAHTYGLQTTPELAEELLDFLRDILADSHPTAERLMTAPLRCVQLDEPLAAARDLMLRDGYGRLPVLHPRGHVVGLLTERDVVAQQALDDGGRPVRARRVGEALPEDALARLAFVEPDAPREEVLAMLQRPGVVACLVTLDGSADGAPLGIITHADLLYRM